MTAKIYIASKHESTKHTYWVYDPDGNPYSGDEQIIRGGLPNDPLESGMQYVIEAGRPIADSRDALNGDDPFTQRYYTTVVSGSSLDVQAVWDDMVAAASSFGSSITDPDYSSDSAVRLQEDIYWLPSPDCHTLTATIGEAGGIDVLGNLPKVGGDTGGGDRTPSWYYPGIDARLGTVDNSTVALDPAIKAYLDQGGVDNYTLDPSALTDPHQQIRILEDSNGTTADRITLLNVDPNDITVVRQSNGNLDIFLDGRTFPIITIVGQFDGGGAKINNLYVEPVSGPTVSFALSNPDNFSPQGPTPLPDLLSGGIQPDFDLAKTITSPLVIDLSSGHTGVTLTSWNATTTHTFFDLKADGFAVQTAWVSGDTGLLARDLDSNGTIDSAAELFGSPTVDGFAKLALLDSNHDLRIDANDAAWSTLVVWKDANGDAVTQSGELYSLASLNIESIDLAALSASTSTISGNPISHTSKVMFTGGATATIADAWFVHDNTNSYYTGDYTLDAETLFLPTLRGYGKIPDLTISMSQDSDLKDSVSDFVSGFSMASFADADDLNNAIEEILYKWAGIEGVSPTGRGDWIDGQHLALLEVLLGAPYISQIGTSNPTAAAAELLEGDYRHAFDFLAASLLLQGGASGIFSGAVTYNPGTGDYEGSTALSQTAIDDLVALAPSPGTANVEFWEMIARFIDNTHGITNLTVSEQGWLDDAVNDSDSSLHWDDITAILSGDFAGSSLTGTSGVDTMSGGAYDDTISSLGGNDTIHGNGGKDTIYAGSGDDTVYGDANADTIYGDTGNDVLYGGDGSDKLYGQDDADDLHGGSGGNTLEGGGGNDRYFYDGGTDVISDTGGTDQVVMLSGIVLGDLTINRISSGSTTDFSDLLITVAGESTIQIRSHYTSSSYQVESILFSDTTTLNLTALSGISTLLTSGNDTFSAGSGNSAYSVTGFDGDDTITVGGTGAHTIDGGNGNDTLQGGSSSDDTYIASAGFDTINENYGTDTIVVPVGYTIDDVTFYRILGGSGPTSHMGISIAGLGEIEIYSFFNNIAYAVETMHFLEDNTTVTLTGMDITTVGTSGNDNLDPPSANASANDILDGREGNDNLYGGAGDDTFIFSAGHDTINESVGGSGSDAVLVRNIYDPADIDIFFDTLNNLQMVDSDGNEMTVYRQGVSSGYQIEHIVFGDSTDWAMSSIEVETHGTSGADNFDGQETGDASSDDVIYGYGGDDTIRGGTGNDLIYGGNGADALSAKFHSILYGDDGNDTLTNSAGSGDAAATVVTMYGGDGADTFHAGVHGQAVMHGGNGADTIWCSGGGSYSDTIVFDAATAFDDVDVIKQFTATTGHDKIDIRDVLDLHYDPLTDLITNFVQITTSGSNSEVYVDTTGTATFGSAQHIATIEGVTGLTDEAALVTAGTLLAA